MAGVSPLPAEVTDRPRGPTNRELFSAIAQLRWRMLVNSLRTIRGRLELVSRVLVGFGMTMGSLGVAIFLVPHVVSRDLHEPSRLSHRRPMVHLRFLAALPHA